MRWTALFALAAFLSAIPAFAQTTSQTTPKKTPKPPSHLPEPTAEPANGAVYASPTPREKQGPTEADRGPFQKYFVIASDLDEPGSGENEETANTPVHEKTSLDKRIKVSLVHDVENDSDYKGASNHALLFEIKYINWGAVTDEQLKARQGHYFTISWENGGSKSDFTARFEYRQVKSKEVVRTLTQNMPHVSGTVRSYFAVVDKAYLAYGPVCSWRFTILKGDTVVAETKSFIW
jgi:hypothetical protein